jgi:putative FmdB family regulatory protein
MPTYDYKCKACGETLEIFQPMTEAPKRKCPACGKNSLERQIGTGAAVLFKGSGFYQTDYRSESYKKGAQAEKPAGETKADAKPDGKSGAQPAESGTAKAAEPKAAPKHEHKDKKSKAKT